MFLLLLMGLGAAGVKAQVRIGGDAAPNAAAVLDLNATDATIGTKGLALPRVSLTNVSTPLTGNPVVNGMMVYNTNPATTGGMGAGVYYWDGSRWNYAGQPASVAYPGYFALVLDTTITWSIAAVNYPQYRTFSSSKVNYDTDWCNSSFGWGGVNSFSQYVQIWVYNVNALTIPVNVRCYRFTITH